jgi:hypothetical protein
MPFSGAQSTDTTPPTTTASVAGTTGDNGWYKQNNVTVTLTAVDNGNGSGVAHTYYMIDGVQHEYTSPFDVAEGDYTGQHTLAYFSVDAAGNLENARLLGIKVDTTAPTMNLTVYNTTNGKITTPDANGYYIGGVNANLTASDNTSNVRNISYSFDGTTWYSYNSNFALPDGQYTLLFGSYDNAGNAYNNTTVSVKVFNPRFDPIPYCDKWYTDNVTVYFASPASGDIDYFEFSLIGGPWLSSRSTSYPIRLTTEGNISLDYRGVNETYGYKSAVNHTWYGIDRTDPTMDISISGHQSSSGWWEGDVKVNLNTHDNGGIQLIQYSWDKTHWTDININPYKSNAVATLSMSQQSSKTIYARCVDARGHVSDIASKFIYFAPGSMDQGSMSGQNWINGQTSGGPTTGPDEGTSSDDNNPTPYPTWTPVPTPELVPSPTPVAENSTGMNSPLAIGVLVAMLILIVVAGVAVYLFVLKPK